MSGTGGGLSNGSKDKAVNGGGAAPAAPGGLAKALLHARVSDLEERKQDRSIVSVDSAISGVFDYAPSAEPAKRSLPSDYFDRRAFALSLISYSKPEGEHAPIRHKVREILLKVVSSTLFSDLDVRIICNHLYNTMVPGGLFGKYGSKMGKLLHSIAVPDEVALPEKITNGLPPADEHARNKSSQIRSVLRDASEILTEEHHEALARKSPFFWSNEAELYKVLSHSGLGDRALTSLVRAIYEVNAGVLGIPLEQLHDKFTMFPEIGHYRVNYQFDERGLPTVTDPEDPKRFATRQYAANGESMVVLSETSSAFIYVTLVSAGLDQDMTAYRQGILDSLPVSYTHRAAARDRFGAEISAMRHVQHHLHTFFVRSLLIRQGIQAADDVARLEDAVPDTHDGNALDPAAGAGIAPTPAPATVNPFVIDRLKQERDEAKAKIEKKRAKIQRLKSEQKIQLKAATGWCALQTLQLAYSNIEWTAEEYARYESLHYGSTRHRRVPDFAVGKTYHYVLDLLSRAYIQPFTLLSNYVARLPFYIEHEYYDYAENSDEKAILDRVRPDVKAASQYISRVIHLAHDTNKSMAFLEITGLADLLTDIRGDARIPAMAQPILEAICRLFGWYDPKHHASKSLRSQAGDEVVNFADPAVVRAEFFREIMLPLVGVFMREQEVNTSTDKTKKIAHCARVAVRMTSWTLLTMIGQVMSTISAYQLVERGHPSRLRHFDVYTSFIEQIGRLTGIVCDVVEHVTSISHELEFTYDGHEVKVEGHKRNPIGYDHQKEFYLALKGAMTAKLPLPDFYHDINSYDDGLYNAAQRVTEIVPGVWGEIVPQDVPFVKGKGTPVNTTKVPSDHPRHQPQLYYISELLGHASRHFAEYFRVFPFLYDPIEAARWLNHTMTSESAPLSLVMGAFDASKVPEFSAERHPTGLPLVLLAPRLDVARPALAFADSEEDAGSRPESPLAGAGAASSNRK